MIGLYGSVPGRKVNRMRLNFRNSKLNFCVVIIIIIVVIIIIVIVIMNS